VAALHHLGAVVFHVVAQVVEAEFVVGRVGDVAGVGLAALVIVHAMGDDAGGQAEEAIDLAHPFGVATGQVVVDGDNMDAIARKRVEIDRKGCDQGLAFTGLHFGDGVFIEDHAADQLDVEWPEPDGAAGCLAHCRVGRHQQIVEFGSRGESAP
jgi:hypothetical protein